MEVRISFTVAEHGHDPANGERFMEAFMAVFPDGGPSVSQNVRTGALTITFSLDAPTAVEAMQQGIDIFGRGAAATDLDVTDVLDLEATVVMADDLTEHAELQPA